MKSARTRPEILAPAGAPDCLPAAVAGGADAVFLGLRHFNARGRAENFRKADLGRHVAYLHRHGVKAYLVMNTLLHDDEYAKAFELAGCADDAGIDAVIIQDIGLWRALAREFPRLKRHASTQMTVHDPAQVAVLAKLGAERVILARELNLAEVRACTVEAAKHGVETEHFVHGALCYAYSGQCLMSNFAGCRSANRGTCAQNCRFDYEVDGQATAETEISMKDLALVGRLGELAEAGVASLKIEGRLKGPDYVYTVSKVYRAAADAWVEGRRFALDDAKAMLRGVFARTHTDAPLAGDYSSASRLHRWAPELDAEPDARLISLDRARGRAEVACKRAPRAGQGYAFTHGTWNGGFLVIAVDPSGPGRWRCKVRVPEHGPRLPDDLPLFLNADHERKRETAEAMASVPLDDVGEGMDVVLTVTGGVGEPLRAIARAADGRSAEAVSASPLQAARSAPLDATTVAEKLGALGGTPFRLSRCEMRIVGDTFLPAAELKQVRRQLVDALVAQPVPDAVPAAPAHRLPPEPGVPRRTQAALWVAVNSLAAARAAIAAGAAQAWLDDATLDLWAAKAPTIARDGLGDGALWLRHPATARTSPHLATIGLPVIAGQLGALVAARAAGLRVVADHACNVFSTETLAALSDLGAEAAVISLECSSREVARLAARCGEGTWPALALVAHGRVPAMLTRQDHGLAIGATRGMRAVEKDGGLPYDLQRRAGGDTVVWEGRRLCCAEQVADTATLVDAWVLELGDLAPDAVAEIVALYLRLRDGAISADELSASAARHAPHGIFPGHLHQGSRELDLVLERQG